MRPLWAYDTAIGAPLGYRVDLGAGGSRRLAGGHPVRPMLAIRRSGNLRRKSHPAFLPTWSLATSQQGGETRPRRFKDDWHRLPSAPAAVTGRIKLRPCELWYSLPPSRSIRDAGCVMSGFDSLMQWSCETRCPLAERRCRALLSTIRREALGHTWIDPPSTGRVGTCDRAPVPSAARRRTRAMSRTPFGWISFPFAPSRRRGMSDDRRAVREALDHIRDLRRRLED